MMGALRWLEAVLALALAWVLVFLVPLRLTRRLFGIVTAPGAGAAAMCPPPAHAPAQAVAPAQALARRVLRVVAALPWRPTCLVRAVAVQLMLIRRGIRGGVIRLGVRKREGALEAHAWLILGDAILTGAEDAPGFTPLADLSGGKL